jgi:hypothetical protein
MADFIGNATSTQLLILMSIPLTGAVILIGLLVFFSGKRNRKQKMKLGIPLKAKASSDEAIPEHNIEDNKVDTEAVSMDIPEQPEEKIDLAARLGNRPPVAPPSLEAAELLRLLRDPQSGDLIVEVAGRRYTKLADVDDKEVGQYILELVAHLLVFTNGVIATEIGVKSVYLPKRLGKIPLPLTKPTPVSQLPDPAAYDSSSTSSPQPEPTSSEPELVPKPPPEAEAAFLASLQARPPQPEPQQRGGGFFVRSKPASEAGAVPGFNLADEINKIVQTRLMISPLSSTDDVEIVSDPGGGIRIIVDGVGYASPDDIPDLEVKTLIKESIKQWERSL